MRGTETLALLCALLLFGCVSAAPKPGCAPGSTEPIVATCAAEMAAGLATQVDCDARIDSWQAGCLR